MDNRVRVLENLLAYGGDVVMFTVTPPGADVLPWDELRCAGRLGCPHWDSAGKRNHSGAAGCRVDHAAAITFNRQAQRRWSALHNAARAKVNRDLGAGALDLLAYTPEPQARGVWHFHGVLGAKDARARSAIRLYLDELKRLAALRAPACDVATRARGDGDPLYGWGFIDDPTDPRDKRYAKGLPRSARLVGGMVVWERMGAARYLSKYMTADAGAKAGKGATVSELVRQGSAPRRVVYVGRRLTMQTRVTMRNLRSRRYVFAATGLQPTCREAESLLLAVKVASMERQTLLRSVGRILLPWERRTVVRDEDAEHRGAVLGRLVGRYSGPPAT